MVVHSRNRQANNMRKRIGRIVLDLYYPGDRDARRKMPSMPEVTSTSSFWTSALFGI